MFRQMRGLRVIAVLEGAKGCLALVVALGLHALAGKNIQGLTEQLVRHLHLNPASHYPRILIQAAAKVSDANINLLALGVIVYTLIRFVEAYGLWNNKRWTEWFALLSGAVYVPFELREIIAHPNLLTITALVINVIVLWYLYRVMFRSR